MVRKNQKSRKDQKNRKSLMKTRKNQKIQKSLKNLKNLKSLTERNQKMLFLVVGMIFGSDGLGLQFHNAAEAQHIGMVALSVILFSGGMDTRYADIRPVALAGIALSTAGVVLTAVIC